MRTRQPEMISRPGRDLLRISLALYPAMLVLSNLCLSAGTYAYNREAREHAADDEASRIVGAVATRMAGYDIDVACLNDIPSASDDNVTTQGEVARYKLVDPLLNTHTLSLNPRTIKFNASYCADIIEDQRSTEGFWDRRDDFRAYAILAHEIVHLDETRDDDETGTQCEAIASLPERLARVGFSSDEATFATWYSDNESRSFLTKDYYRYPCPTQE